MRALPPVLLLALTAAGPAPVVERMGAVELAYDPARWTVGKTTHDRWKAAPVDAGEGPVVQITTDYGGPCSQEAMAALAYTAPGFHGRRGTAGLPSGLKAHWARGDTGCRNLARGQEALCVVHGGQTLLLVTEPQGCRGNAFGDDDPVSLLQGLRPR